MVPGSSPASPDDQAFLRVYDRLRRCAQLALAGEKAGVSVEATDLANIAYVRLRAAPATPAADDEAFYRRAAAVIRHILVDRARARAARKRGGGQARVPLADLPADTDSDDDRLVALDAALAKLERVDPRAAELVQLRYFAGLTQPEAAARLGVSLSTAEADWRRAKAWLAAETAGENH
jgi:RNA polymerase sigma factor (TIGR02999 family)